MADNRVKGNRIRIIVSVCFGFLFGLACVAGSKLERYESLRFDGGMDVFAFLMLWVFAGAVAYAVVSWRREGSVPCGDKILRCAQDDTEGARDDTEGARNDTEGLRCDTPRKQTLFIFGIIFACNLIVLLGVYPGFFVYDAFEELNEVLTRNFTTHHPLTHVLLLGGTITALHKAGASWNTAIFLYLLAQCAFLSGVYTYVVCYVKKRGAPVWLVLTSMLWFALFPTVVMYTLCSSKDGLFSAFFLLFLIRLHEWIREPDVMRDRRFLVSFVLSAALMMLFRHNAVYAYAVFVVGMIVAVMIRGGEALSASFGGTSPRGRGKILRCAQDDIVGAQNLAEPEGSAPQRGGMRYTLAMLLCPLFLAIVCGKAETIALHADDSEHQEMLTVPIMQLARVYAYTPEDFSEEEKETLYRYLPEEALQRYVPHLSDGVKIAFDNAAYDADAGAFRSLWWSKAKAHPMTYVNAWLNTSYGYWYPLTVINVYQGNTVFTFTYTESSYFGYETEEPGERHSFFPSIDALYRSISLERLWQEMPIVRFFLSPACMFWAYVLLFLRVVCAQDAGERRKGMVFLPLFLYWLTLQLGPTYLVRYIVILWTALPFTLWMVLFDRGEGEKL